MKIFILFSISLICTMSVMAQDSLNKNTIFFEAGGNGIFYSFNFDRILKDKQEHKWVGRAGITYLPFLNSGNRQIVGIPLELSYLKGRNYNYLEIGLGFTPMYDGYKHSEFSKKYELLALTFLRIGYRHQKPEGGLFFKAGITPVYGIIFNYSNYPNQPVIIDSENKRETFALPFMGIALGWTLKK
jgi:hypothetical protein